MHACCHIYILIYIVLGKIWAVLLYNLRIYSYKVCLYLQGVSLNFLYHSAETFDIRIFSLFVNDQLFPSLLSQTGHFVEIFIIFGVHDKDDGRIFSHGQYSLERLPELVDMRNIKKYLYRRTLVRKIENQILLSFWFWRFFFWKIIFARHCSHIDSVDLYLFFISPIWLPCHFGI